MTGGLSGNPHGGVGELDVHVRAFGGADPAGTLAALFNIEPTRAQKIVDAAPVTVKRNLERGAATQFQRALERIGANVLLIPAGSQPPPLDEPIVTSGTDLGSNEPLTATPGEPSPQLTAAAVQGMAIAGFDPTPPSPESGDFGSAEFDPRDFAPAGAPEAQAGFDPRDFAPANIAPADMALVANAQPTEFDPRDFAPASSAEVQAFDPRDFAPADIAPEMPMPDFGGMPMPDFGPSDPTAGFGGLPVPSHMDPDLADLSAIAPDMPTREQREPPREDKPADPLPHEPVGHIDMDTPPHPGFYQRLGVAFLVPLLGKGLLWYPIFFGYGVVIALFSSRGIFAIITVPTMLIMFFGSVGEYFLQAAQVGQADDGQDIPRMGFEFPSRERLLFPGFMITVAVVCLYGTSGLLQFRGSNAVLIWLSALLPSVYLPMGIAVSAMTGNAVQILNPVAVGKAIFRGGLKYGVIVATGIIITTIGWQAVGALVMDELVRADEEMAAYEASLAEEGAYDEDDPEALLEARLDELDERMQDPNYIPTNEDELAARQAIVDIQNAQQREMEAAIEAQYEARRHPYGVVADASAPSGPSFVSIFIAILLGLFIVAYSIAVQGYMLGCLFGEQPEDFDFL